MCAWYSGYPRAVLSLLLKSLEFKCRIETPSRFGWCGKGSFSTSIQLWVGSASFLPHPKIFFYFRDVHFCILLSAKLRKIICNQMLSKCTYAYCTADKIQPIHCQWAIGESSRLPEGVKICQSYSVVAPISLRNSSSWTAPAIWALRPYDITLRHVTVHGSSKKLKIDNIPETKSLRTKFLIFRHSVGGLHRIKLL